MQITTECFKKEGMYLFFPNGESMDFSVENVRKVSEEIWNDPAMLPQQMREHVDFKVCSVCPFRGQEVLCSAMKPLLPFLEQIEKFVSYDRATAVYVHRDGEITIVQTDLQQGLQYLTNMSLFEYCENAKQFRHYFRGIRPFMKLEEAITRLVLNITLFHRDDSQKVEKVIKELRYHVTVASRSCVRRLGVMCKSDAFKNAYAKTQCFTEFLSINPESLIEAYFNEPL